METGIGSIMLINKVDMEKYNKLSRGNQTIVGLIIALASRVKLAIFDELSLGLDTAFRYKFYRRTDRGHISTIYYLNKFSHYFMT